MKTLTIIPQTDISSEKGIPGRIKKGKLLRLLPGIFLISCLICLSSCLVGPPQHSRPSGYHGNQEKHGNNGHHGDHDDNGNHNNNNPHNK